jgi:hypothetical protein
VHNLQWIPVLDTFCRSLLLSRAFCKVLVSFSRSLLKVLTLISRPSQKVSVLVSRLLKVSIARLQLSDEQCHHLSWGEKFGLISSDGVKDTICEAKAKDAITFVVKANTEDLILE